jgi:hypothetical protein
MSQNEEAIQVLKDARALIHKGWHQKAFWRNSAGLSCRSEQAESCCLVGAIIKASQARISSGIAVTSDAQIRVEAALQVFVPSGDFYGWNDETGRTKEEVLALVDTAILSLEGTPSGTAIKNSADS